MELGKNVSNFLGTLKWPRDLKWSSFGFPETKVPGKCTGQKCQLRTLMSESKIRKFGFPEQVRNDGKMSL